MTNLKYFNIIYLISLFSFQTVSNASVQICDLRCNGEKTPFGFSDKKPVFSWKLESPERGQYQSAYRIIIAASIKDLEAEKKLIWDTGKRTSDNSFGIVFNGSNLLSNTSCYWRVKVWDKADKPSEWSKIISFHTGLLDQGDWKAQWISTPDTIDSPWLRKEFTLKTLPEKATVYINTIGFSEIYINGSKIGKEVLSPAAVDFSKKNFYLAHDITSFLRNGKNVIGVCLSTGNFSLQYYPKPAIRVQLILTENNGDSFVISDSTWKYKESNRKKIGTWAWNNMGGEIVDLRKYIPDWNHINYDDKYWKNCILSEKPNDKTTFQNCPANVVTNEYPCKEITEIEDNIYLLDFGTNLTGDIIYPLKNQKLNDTLHFYYSDFCSQKPVLKAGIWDFGGRYINQADMIISAGGSNEEFTSKFNYHGFRYVLVTGVAGNPEKEKISARMIEMDLESVGSFECSNDFLNKIHKVNLQTFRCLDLGGINSDCPHRERLGYGDGQVAVESAIYNLDCRNFYEKWTNDWFLAQYSDGDFPHSAPSPYFAGGGPAWGGNPLALAWKSYVYYGNRKVLENYHSQMKKYLEFLDSKSKNDILKPYGRKEKLSEWDFLGDWVAPGRGMDTSNWPSDTANTFFNNAYRIYLYTLSANTAKRLGLYSEAEEMTLRIKHLQNIVHTHFFNPGKMQYINNDQVNLLMPLVTGIVPDSLEQLMFRKLEDDIIIINKGHLNTGGLGTKFLLDLLIEKDRNDLIYIIANQKTYPGWGYMIENGATTFWEQWNGYWSNIHSCFTSIGGWFYNGLAGITQEDTSTGFHQIIIRPYVPDDMVWLRASYNSVSGKIECNWQKNGNVLTINVVIPANTSAKIYLPKTEIHSLSESGKNLKDLPEIKFMANTDKYTILQAGSGNYSFQLPAK